jgi:hypothetical protein
MSGFQPRRAAKEDDHRIDLSQGFDEVDEISGDEQLALCWCDTHQKWEWHWVPMETD